MREKGYYWVRRAYVNSSWEPAEYDCGAWYVTGDELSHRDRDFAEISPRLNPPTNPPKP